MERDSGLRDVIAERELLLVTPQERRPVQVRLGRPIKVDGCAWECPVQITGLGHGRTRRFGGVDALDSLFYALSAARLHLTMDAEIQGGTIHFLSEREGPFFTSHLMNGHYWDIIIDLCHGLEEVRSYLESEIKDAAIDETRREQATGLHVRLGSLIESRNRRPPDP